MLHCQTQKPGQDPLHTHTHTLQAVIYADAPQGWFCIFKVYAGSWGDLEGVIKCHMEEAQRYDLENQVEPRKEAVGFDKPSKGTSVEKFREMILDHLKVKILARKTKLSKGFLLHFYP